MLPAEGFRSTLAKLVAILERLEVRFHITGGLTSVAYGDRVRAVQETFLGELTQVGFYFSESTARRAIESRQMFQILDMDQVVELDLYVRCLIPGELDRIGDSD